MAGVALLVVAGCGGPEDDFALPASTGGGGGGAASYDPSTATATITGDILFEGTPPERRLLPTTADPRCGGVTHMSETVVVTDDGKLENTIVYVNSGHEGDTYAVPTTPVVLNQMNCRYEPHIFTMMAGQPLLIRNSDDTTHNIHAFPEENMVFNFAQARQGMESTETFEIPEYMPPIPVRCDVHQWMGTNIGVFDHPFHTNSGTTGTYSISVPPGTYEIMTWHEEYGEMASMVTVGDGETVELDFTYSADSAD